jgi:hypothetical protein
MFYFGRRFATTGTTSRAAWWNGLWQYPGFRRSQRILTLVWGASLLVEALLQIELTFQLPVGAVVVVVVNTACPTSYWRCWSAERCSTAGGPGRAPGQQQGR